MSFCTNIGATCCNVCEQNSTSLLLDTSPVSYHVKGLAAVRQASHAAALYTDKSREALVPRWAMPTRTRRRFRHAPGPCRQANSSRCGVVFDRVAKDFSERVRSGGQHVGNNFQENAHSSLLGEPARPASAPSDTETNTKSALFCFARRSVHFVNVKLPQRSCQSNANTASDDLA